MISFAGALEEQIAEASTSAAIDALYAAISQMDRVDARVDTIEQTLTALQTAVDGIDVPDTVTLLKKASFCRKQSD